MDGTPLDVYLIPYSNFCSTVSSSLLEELVPGPKLHLLVDHGVSPYP